MLLLRVLLLRFEFNMTDFINICDIHDWSNQNDGLTLINKLMEFGILPSTKQCEKCNNSMTLGKDENYIDKYKWFCRNYVVHSKTKRRRCTFKTNLRKDTFFFKSKLTLAQIAKFICCWVDNIPLNVIRKHTRIQGQATLVDFGNFCREVIFESFIQSKDRLGGQGKIVEIDESKFGRRKFNRGHHVEGQWVFGGFERGSGKVFMVPVEERSSAILLPIIKEWILPGTQIHSDCWKAYDCLSNEGFEHLTVNHSIAFVDKETLACTNHIEATWRAAKKSYEVAGRRKHFFGGYLSKYIFLKSCRTRKIDPFIEFCVLAGKIFHSNIKMEQMVSDDEEQEEFDDSDVAI